MGLSFSEAPKDALYLEAHISGTWNLGTIANLGAAVRVVLQVPNGGTIVWNTTSDAGTGAVAVSINESQSDQLRSTGIYLLYILNYATGTIEDLTANGITAESVNVKFYDACPIPDAPHTLVLFDAPTCQPVDCGCSDTGGPIVHSTLLALDADDHTQYLTEARGDARYYTEAEHINKSTGVADAGKPIVLDADGMIDPSMLPAAGLGDMTKAEYDPGDDGIIDAAAGGLGADASLFSGIVKMSAGVASVAVGGTDYANASHTHNASDITAGTLAHERGGLEADVSAYNGLIKIEGGATGEVKCNFSSNTAPTIATDSSAGYSVGSLWLDTTGDNAYICMDASAGAAVWHRISGMRIAANTGGTVDVDGYDLFNIVENLAGLKGIKTQIVDAGTTKTLLLGLDIDSLSTSTPDTAADTIIWRDQNTSQNYKMTFDALATLLGVGGAISASSVTFTPFSTVTSTDVQSAIEEIYGDIVIESGFENRTDSALSFVDGTQTFSIAPTGVSFSFWVQGEKYTKTTSQDLVISADEGLHYIYFDETGTLTETLTFTSAIITDYTFCAFVYWDATNSTAILFGDERHGRTMDSSTHAYLHNIFSTQYDSGLALGSILADDTGSSNTHIQCAVSNGVIRDEDIRISIENGSPQTLDPVAQLPILYRSGAAGAWRKIAATGYLVTTAGTGRAAYNEWTGATWQLTEVTNNAFLLTHIFATNDINSPVVIIAGQAKYGNLAAAQAAALTELEQLASGPLDDALPEWKAIGTLIVQTSNSYSNAVKSRIRTTAEGDDYIDFRTTNISPSGGTNTGDHGSLTGLADDDHTHYSLADGTRWTGTQTANRLAASNASGNLVVSDIVFNDASNSLDLSGNYLHVRDVASGGALFVGTTINKGSLSDTEATSTFQIQRAGGKLSLVGGTSLDLTANGGDTLSWPDTDGSAGAAMVTDGSGALSLQDKAFADVRDFGAVGDGVTDDSTAIGNAIADGRPVLFPAGTYVCGNLSITTSQEWHFVGGAKLLREATASGNWIVVTGSRFEARAMSLDGNTANTNAGHNIVFNSGVTETLLIDCVSVNAVENGSGGFGSGVVYNIPVATAQEHKIINLDCNNNEINGLSVVCGKNFQITGGNFSDNGNMGILLNNFDVTFTQKIQNVTITGARVYGNGGSGIQVGNIVADNDVSTSARLYGHTNLEASNVTITGCELCENTNYGVVVSGEFVNVDGNMIRDNAPGGATWGGAVVNGKNCRFANNIVEGNGAFGVDVGGADVTEIVGNKITGNGASGYPGLNIEAATNLTVSGNTLKGNNTSSGIEINVFKSGGDGGTNFLPNLTTKVFISGNFIFCDNTRTGIYVKDGVDDISIMGNTFYGGNASRFAILIADKLWIKGNTAISGSDQVTPDGSGVLYVPELLESIFVNSATTIEGIRYNTQSTITDDMVSWVDVTAGGSGYTSQPTVSFSGGGGSGATAVAHINNGVVIGVRVTANGSGYTAAPTVSFSGGGGSGATATAKIGVPIQNGREMIIHSNVAATYRRTGAVGPDLIGSVAADVSVTANGLMTIRSRFNKWYVQNKNF